MNTFRMALKLTLIGLLVVWISMTITPALTMAATPTLPATPMSLPTALVTLKPEATVIATDPASVVTGYYAAITFKDLDAALALIADNATLCYEDHCYTEKEEIRAFWQREYDSGYVPYVSILRLDKNTVTYAWTSAQNGRVDAWGTGTVIVEAGKVKSDK
jgi:hypothetical protein